VPLAGLLYAITGWLCHDLPNAYVGVNTLGQLLEWTILGLFVLVTLDRYAAVKRLENRISLDLEVARRLQTSLIQPEYEFGTVRIRGFVRQTHDIGGDFYYFRPFQEKYVVFCLGDVMGKGIAASLLMAIVMGFMFEWGKKSSSPAFILKKLNSRLRKLWAGGGHETPFITVFYAVYDEELREVTYSAAGHQGALLVHTDGSSTNLITDGIPVGVFDDADYQEASCRLEPGERVFLFTDGVTEARDGNGELFGMERLQEVLRLNLGRTLEENLESIKEGIARHTEGKAGDDVAVLAMEAPQS